MASLVSVHLAGEGKDEISLGTLPGKFKVTQTDEALTPYGGLAAWGGFLKHHGIIERLADHCPVAPTSPNAALVREVLHSFLLGGAGRWMFPPWPRQWEWIVCEAKMPCRAGQGDEPGKSVPMGCTVRKPSSTRRCPIVSLPTGMRW